MRIHSDANVYAELKSFINEETYLKIQLYDSKFRKK
jgi:hypothetical protein